MRQWRHSERRLHRCLLLLLLLQPQPLREATAPLRRSLRLVLPVQKLRTAVSVQH